MNLLELYCHQQGMDRNDALTILKDNAIISDNCITTGDVCTGDCLKAVTFLIWFKGELVL